MFVRLFETAQTSFFTEWFVNSVYRDQPDHQLLEYCADGIHNKMVRGFLLGSVRVQMEISEPWKTYIVCTSPHRFRRHHSEHL